MWPSFLSKVSDVFTASSVTPLDSFKGEWLSIKVFYHGEEDDIEAAMIPQSMNKMIQILIEEEDRLCSDNPTPLPGPCLNFFFQEGILTFLCNACIVDDPAGMRKTTMAAISNLLRSTQYIPLLPHQSVQVPLSTLIKRCLDIKLEQQNQGENVKSFDEEFLALLETIALKIQEIPSCIYFFFDDNDEEQVSFPIFDCLVLHIHQVDTSGERSRQALQRLISVACIEKHSKVAQYIASTDFVSRVVTSLIYSYMNICDALSKGSEVTGQHLNGMLFCSNILLKCSGILSEDILEGIKSQLLLGMLIPDFMNQEDTNLTIRASAFIQYYFRHVQSPTMQKLLWELLIGAQNTPETKRDRSCRPLRNTLMHRIQSPNDPIAISAMGIIGSLLELHEEAVFMSLLSRNIPCYSLDAEHISSNCLECKKWLQERVLMPGMMEADSFLPYLHDAQLAVYQSFIKTSEWKYEEGAPKETIYEGELLSYMFHRLSTLLDNSKVINYYLTELFLKCIRYPHPSAYSYFLDFSQLFPAGIRTLKQTLLQISDDISNRCLHVSGIMQKIEVVKQLQSQPDAVSKYYTAPNINAEELALLGNVTIFEEFCAELAATAHAKACNAILCAENTK